MCTKPTALPYSLPGQRDPHGCFLAVIVKRYMKMPFECMAKEGITRCQQTCGNSIDTRCYVCYVVRIQSVKRFMKFSPNTAEKER